MMSFLYFIPELHVVKKTALEGWNSLPKYEACALHALYREPTNDTPAPTNVHHAETDQNVNYY